MTGEKISNFFENRLSKLRFLSLLVMRGFFATTKFFRTNAAKVVQLKVKATFLKKVWCKSPLNTDKGWEVFFGQARYRQEK